MCTRKGEELRVEDIIKSVGEFVRFAGVGIGIFGSDTSNLITVAVFLARRFKSLIALVISMSLSSPTIGKDVSKGTMPGISLSCYRACPSPVGLYVITRVAVIASSLPVPISIVFVKSQFSL